MPGLNRTRQPHLALDLRLWLILALLAGSGCTPLRNARAIPTVDLPATAADAYAGGDYTRAEVAYQQWLQDAPEDPEPALALADLYLTWGRPEAGLAALDEAVERGATGDPVRRRKIQLLTAAERWEAIQSTVEQDPVEPGVEALAALTRAYLHAQECEAARETAARWLVAARETAQTTGEAARIRALLEGDLVALQRADPDALTGLLPCAGTCLPELGLALVRESQWGLAACTLQRAIREDQMDVQQQSDVDAWLGEALSRLGYAEEAQRHLREAVQQAPDSPLAWLLLGNHALAQGDLETARAALLNAQRLDPANPAPCLAVAELKAQVGRYDEVTTWIEAALDRAPEDPAVWKAAARFYLRRGLTPKKALTIAENAAALAPEDAEAQTLLGWSHLMNGSPREALDHLDLAIAQTPTMGEAHARRAEALYALGEAEAAEAARVRAENLGYGLNQ
jgi:tetratricopeptide (TPR) repeat protein